MEIQLKHSMIQLEFKLSELEKEWDRLDDIGSVTHVQERIVKEIEETRNQITRLENSTL